MNTSWPEVPFEDLLLETKDGEWGEASSGVGLREVLIIRGTDFDDVDNPSAEFPQRWVKDHLVERKQLRAGDIILETAGGTSSQSTGRSVLLKSSFFEHHAQLPVLCASFSRHLRIKHEKYDARFISYLLQGLYRFGYMGVFNIQHTGVSRFQFTDFKNHTKLRVPEKPTQRKIAAVLAAYDDLIEANRRRIALLERMAEELYRDWFVRLRFPGHAKTRRVKGVPVGWTVEQLRAVADESSRSTKPGAHLEGRHYLPLELLGSKQMLPLDHLPHTEAQSSLVTFEQDEFLFGAMRPYQHKVAIAPFRGITRGTCFVIRPKQPERWAWLFLTLFQPTSVDHAMNICNGSDRPYVVWNKGMEKMNVLVPPLELTASFDSVARPILSAITGFYFLQRNLQRTRDLLLPRLIAGKLPVEDLAIAFPPSMVESKPA